MKITAFLLITACLQVSANSFGQTVSLSETNAPLDRVFSSIRKQTGFTFIYTETLLRQTRPVTIRMKDEPLEKVLDACFLGQPVTYEIVEKAIVVKPREEVAPIEITPPLAGDIHGRVTDSLGNPLAGASVTMKGSHKGTVTNAQGEFSLKAVKGNVTLVISFTGYADREIRINGIDEVYIVLARSNSPLDVAQVIAYGTTTQRLSTGDVTTVTAKEIGQQPVTNVLAAMEGRVPGLFITQATGAPGGGFTVQIRGQNSLGNGTDPFYVVDGVPYPSQTMGLINGQLKSGSPLNFINPSDVESVEVLKDADATAIYGSRAANGAILITTKKGKAGKMTMDINVSSGVQKLDREEHLLNTRQYLQLRREAFVNDGETPGPNDHDINGDWDTTRYTDWQKVLLNNQSHFNNAEVSISGGNTNVQYLIAGGYNSSSTVFPTLLSGDGVNQSTSLHFNINTASGNKKFKVGLTGSYESNKNTVQSEDFYEDALITAPDAPALYNPDGSLNWQPLIPGQPGTWQNPFSYLYLTYKGLTSNIVGAVNLDYTLLPGLDLRTNLGYTNTQTDEVHTAPSTVSDPGYNSTSGSSNFNETNTHSWVIEPEIDYKLNLGRGVFTAQAGGTAHENNNTAQTFSAYGFISDALLENIQAATTIYPTSTSAQYKYIAAFGRLNYDWEDKYIIDLTGRRDGSSRFGPGKQFANFGAIGVAWIFTRENVFKHALPFLSFGKIRGSYGTSGNDQVGDYRFIDLYQVAQYGYGGSQGLQPVSLFNPDLAWELNKKAEVGIELGFLKDRIILQASFYRNRCGNQLVSTPVSDVTGFTNIPANLAAVVQNAGQEFVLRTVNIKTKDFRWESSFNISFSQNKLLSFPGLATSGYQSTYKIGQSILATHILHMIGVNDTTGLYEFAGAKGPTYKPDYSTDLTKLVNRQPKYFGGFGNSFQYRGFSLDLLFQFTKKIGNNIWGEYGNMPGVGNVNVPVQALDHWQKPGDVKPLQRASQDYSGAAYKVLNYVGNSDFVIGDASYIRLKNLSFSYNLPDSWKRKLHLQNCRFFAQGQNLLTITRYNGIDPESGGITQPPLKVYTAGFQITF